MSLNNNWKRHTDDRDNRTAGGAGDNEEVLSVQPAKRKKRVSDPLDMISFCQGREVMMMNVQK
jgi:hypothetical protein